jgi:4-hydroxy-2-oxoheptanedioate aldolase
MGTRSMGANRAVQYAGADYWQGANEEVLLFAMIETRDGLKNLDEILSVKGLSGVYVGPSDLSMAHGKPPTLDPSDPEMIEAIKYIAKKTNEKGLIAGVHTDGPKTALTRFEQGYHYCAVLNDVRMLATAASQAIKDIRGGGKVEQAKTY